MSGELLALLGVVFGAGANVAMLRWGVSEIKSLRTAVTKLQTEVATIAALLTKGAI